jgi:proteasome lid subunit RPN8/RPN11
MMTSSSSLGLRGVSMVQVLEDWMVQEIADIGDRRKPNEACGILLPYKIKGRQVLEMPNRSRTPHDEVVMRGEDIAIELQMLFGEGELFPEGLAETLTFWHTHPGGNLGPSPYDLQNKAHIGRSLVVSLGKEPKATWF